ncbi:MAG: DUF11 domain-containing protein [Anaerolineae bacterium]|nr:DUF11 domain-containing protein [Anaerolineae bacterium]
MNLSATTASGSAGGAILVIWGADGTVLISDHALVMVLASLGLLPDAGRRRLEMKVIRRTLAALLNVVVLLSLTLSLSAPALSQGPGGDDEVLPATAAPQAAETGEPIVAPAAEPPPIDCTDPLPGQVVKLIEDNEIFVALTTDAGWDDSGRIQLVKLDNKSSDSTDLVYHWDWRNDHNHRDDVIWPVITTVDVDADGKDEVISAFKDHDGRLQVISLKNPEVNDGNDLDFDSWTSTSHGRHGQELNHFDIAAGDLNREANGSKEIVVAFRDNDHDLQVVLLDGESDGGIKYLAWWYSTAHGRGDVWDVSVDVGDLDGDGYDDEIVLAFVDGDCDLQVVVLEYTNGGVKEIGWEHWTSYDRGNICWDYAAEIDVTAGDFDGDFTDEIAVAVRDGSKALQITQIVYDPDADTLRDRVNASGRWRDTGHHRNDVDYISAASGDIDGDGYEEIIVAFAAGNDDLELVMLDAESGSPHLRGSSYIKSSGDLTEVHWVSVDAGDIDGDSKAEIVVALADSNWDLQVISFDDNPDCPCADDAKSGLLWRDKWEDHGDDRDSLGMVWMALGDVDGDSIYGDYTGKCEQTDETRLIAMVNRPPYWEDLNPETDVGYGNSIKGGDETEHKVTTSYGGSVTIDESFLLHDIELGPSFTREWEHSLSESWTQGSSVETRRGWTSPDDGLVTLNTVTYYVYQYKKRDGSGLARVSVPVKAQTDAKTTTFWNQSDGGRDFFPDSWVPAYRTAWLDKHSIPGSFGASNQGAGADYHDINGNGTPDYLFAWIDNPVEDNTIYYRVGWDVGGDGKPASWSNAYTVGSVDGWSDAGLGAAVTELNGNNTPELVLAWVDDPAGENSANYRICWDLAADGKFSSCSDKKQIPGWVGGWTQGAGLDILDISGDGRPEMFFGWIDNPDGINHGYYRVGWNLDANGDINNWWPDPRKIEGAFGVRNAGLGLTLADVDGSGQPELIAAWVRDPQGNDNWNWGYATGEDLDGNAHVDSWVPGHHIPGQLDYETGGAALASADLVADDGGPELVVAWIPEGDNTAHLRVGKYWELGGEVDQRPTDIDDPDSDDGQFKIKLYDAWWSVSGKLLWRWDEIQDNQPIYVSVGGANPYWEVTHEQFSEHTTESSESYNYEIGGEAEFLGVGVEGSATTGFEDGTSYTISWETGLSMDGQSSGLPGSASWDKEYKYVPFTYMQEAVSKEGIHQAYMVLDYFVPWRYSDTAGTSAANVTPSAAPAVVLTAPLGITPSVPLIASPSHPDPDTWYVTNTATFTWTQPIGDPAVVDGYRWYLDHNPDTIRSGMSFGLTNTTTYEGLSDGLWYLHLRARGDGGEWSETAHRAVRLDTHPPQITMALDPPHPGDNGGWYNTPVTATVIATDSTGSGVQSIEVSADGVTWQPYTTPLIFDADAPPATLWARATDAVGHTSEPVSTTFGLDLTPPISVVGPDCWLPGGNCVAGVFTDTMGNQYLHLAGEHTATLSGLKGLAIQINGEDWTSADEVGEGQWSFIPTTELGAGCHTFHIQAQDLAGHVEPLYAFHIELVWHPREQPDLSGSSLSVTPAPVRPGETVAFTGYVRNSGWQEAWVPITVELPLGLEVLPDTIGSDGVYEPASRTIAWPPRYLWPGQERPLSFGAQVDAGLPATSLIVSLTALGTWPVADTCPPDALPGFLDLQTTTEVTTTVTVSPTLPAGADVLPPAFPRLSIEGRPATDVREVQLRIGADTDARWMYLREWMWSADSGTWIAAQESDWLPYTPSYAWTLSQGDGVKYLGVWAADAAWNVSALDRRSLTFTNLVESSQFLAAGQRIQYRFPLHYGKLAVFNAIAHEGNPDLYVWQPLNGFRPNYTATGTGFVDTVGFQAAEQGLYLLEVKAEGDSRYQLLLARDISLREATPAGITPSPPEHPLTVSDPLSAGAAVAPSPPAFLKLYLPLVMRNR